ncbi:MAG: hypothetical protein HRT72_13030 [Flavobacteriales bacterium]|nr:hypothetical protein [Flavobacteriales bacterium]
MESTLVYILDDDTGLFMTGRVLRRSNKNIEIKSFDSAIKLHDLLESNAIPHPDIIISDVNMLGFTGVEVIILMSQMENSNPNMKAFIQSATIKPDDQEIIETSELFHGQFERYVTPENIEVILEGVEELVVQ